MINEIKELRDAQDELELTNLKTLRNGKVLEFDSSMFVSGAVRAEVGDIQTDWLPVLFFGSKLFSVMFDIEVGSRVLITDIEKGFVLPVSSISAISDGKFKIQLGTDDEIVHRQGQLTIKTKKLMTDEHALHVGTREVQKSLEVHDDRLDAIEKAHKQTRAAVKEGFKLVAKKDPKFLDLELIAGAL